MKYNQFSYIPVADTVALTELKSLGFDIGFQDKPKDMLEKFVRHSYFYYADSDYPISNLIADSTSDLLSFFKSDSPLCEDIFYMVSLQLLGFIPHVDFEDLSDFLKTIHFPVTYNSDKLYHSLYHLLITRTKDGMTLLDQLTSQGIIPSDNNFHFFNGKSLATFDTSQLIREVVYVQTPLDTDRDGQADLVKVNIIRPKTKHKIPTMMTASPYHQGINGKANDKRLYKMENELTVKMPSTISVVEKPLKTLTLTNQEFPIGNSEETFHHIDSYTLNDYFLARGFANIYVSGIGTAGSDGFMTSGDYQQVESFKAVIDWLNGRAIAFSSHRRDKQVLASWASGKVATTGKSYLGTMSTALATTGVKGLEVIIAEAAISSWYGYYRENGLVCSPGGYPGEDLDVLTELTYSRNLLAGDYLKNNTVYQQLLNEQAAQTDRSSGDYNQFWHERNYLINANNITATCVFTHGLQDWNVKPNQVYDILNALPESTESHAFLHHGQHVYMHNWQSIDFRESMNALLTQKLLGQANHYELPKVIWQDNSQEHTWEALNSFSSDTNQAFPLGDASQKHHVIKNHYTEAIFSAYCKNYKNFQQDLLHEKANVIAIDIPVEDDVLINGTLTLHLRLKSSTNKGLLSAQIYDIGRKKRLKDTPAIVNLTGIDNGRNFSREALRELPFAEMSERLISKGVINLQNRTNLLSIEEVKPDEWMTFDFKLQPSIYKLTKGAHLKVLLCTTDFELTVRDNSQYQLTVSLADSWLSIDC